MRMVESKSSYRDVSRPGQRGGQCLVCIARLAPRLHLLSDHRRNRHGVTLVELLVVMLIVVILAVSMTPMLRDYVVRAQYAAEAIPLVDDLREGTASFRVEQGYLPGLPHDDEGYPLTNATIRSGASYLGVNLASSMAALGRGIPLQTFVRVESESGPEKYRPAHVMAFETAKGCVKTVVALADVAVAEDEQSTFHFAGALNLDSSTINLQRLRPNHLFFRADDGGYGHDGYMVAFGVFGDGNGLPAGTGYAVLEIRNPVLKQAIVARWERWRSVSPSAGQIGMMSVPEAAAIGLSSSKDWKRENVCWIGSPAVLMTTDRAPESETAFQEMLESLRNAGWEW